MGAPSVQGDTSVSIRWYWPSFPPTDRDSWPFPLSSIFSIRPPSSEPLLALREPAESLFSPILLLFPIILNWLCCPSFLPFMSLLGEEETCFLTFTTSPSFDFVPLFFPAPYREEEEEPRKSPLLLLPDGVITASQGSLR